MPLAADRYLDSIDGNTRLIVEAARRGTDPTMPQCPGWTVGHVVVHVGRAFRWMEEIVRTRTQAPLFPRSNDHSFHREDPGLIAWFEESARLFQDTMRAVDPDEAVWSWSGDNRAAFWQRLQAHETAVHRTDAQSAFGRPDPVDGDLARDAIDGLFEWFLPRGRMGSLLPSRGERFEFIERDGPGRWLVSFEGNGVSVQARGGEADVCASGEISDLLLFLWQRTGPETLQVEGRAELLERYRELAPLP